MVLLYVVYGVSISEDIDDLKRRTLLISYMLRILERLRRLLEIMRVSSK